MVKVGQQVTPPTRQEIPSQQSSDPLDALRPWQLTVLYGRLAILSYVRELKLTMGTTAAIERVVREAAAHKLPPPIQAMVLRANARLGPTGARTLSSRTIYDWRRRAAKSLLALAPKDPSPFKEPAWLAPLLKLYRRPQRPSLRWAVGQLPGLLSSGMTAPSYDQVKRFLHRHRRLLEPGPRTRQLGLDL